MPLTRLTSYVLSLGFEQRAERRAELTGALRGAAAALRSNRQELVRRLRAAGFSALLKGGV